MKEKGITKYKLICDYHMSKSLLFRLSHNESVTMNTINMLCQILDCTVENVVKVEKDM